jgi:hypothetical protein
MRNPAATLSSRKPATAVTAVAAEVAGTGSSPVIAWTRTRSSGITTSTDVSSPMTVARPAMIRGACSKYETGNRLSRVIAPATR